MFSEFRFREREHHCTIEGLAPEMGDVEAFVGIVVEGKRFVRNACIFVLRLIAEIVGVEVGDVPQLLGLVLVSINGFLVQVVLDGVCPKLVICACCMQSLQSLGPAAEVVIDFEVLSKLRELLELPQEWEVLAGILDGISNV